jgi:hypothetical protein
LFVRKVLLFLSRFPVILIGTGTLEDKKNTRLSGVLFVNVLQTLGRFPRYSTLIWARNQLVAGN